eukprot:scaffold35992_cov25-Prasinocladus_malaysianus.AAC.1
MEAAAANDVKRDINTSVTDDVKLKRWNLINPLPAQGRAPGGGSGWAPCFGVRGWRFCLCGAVRRISWCLAIGLHEVEYICTVLMKYCNRHEVAQQACLATLPALAKYYDCMPVVFCSVQLRQRKQHQSSEGF